MAILTIFPSIDILHFTALCFNADADIKEM